MKYPYTVLLLNPDYLAVNYGKDVTPLHVEEDSRDDAIAEARRQAFETNEVKHGNPADWYACSVRKGAVANIAGWRRDELRAGLGA